MVETLGNIIIRSITRDVRHNPGLLDGMMGIGMSAFIMSESSNNSICRTFAEKLLGNIISRPMVDKDLSFASGIAGVGWAISFLGRRGHIEGNIDHILFSYDAIIFRSVTNPKNSFTLNTTNGLTGVLLYLTERLNGNSESRDTQQQFLLRELLLNVLEKYDAVAPRAFSRVSKDLYITALWEIPILFRCLAVLLANNIEKNKIEKLCKKWKMYLRGIMPFYRINRLALANTLFKVGTLLGDDEWNLLAIKMIEDLSYEHVMQEIDDRIHNINEGWFYVAYLLYEAEQMPQMPKAIQSQLKTARNQLVRRFVPKFREYIDENKNDGSLKLGLINGISGICLLFTMCPECLEDSDNNAGL